MEINDMLCNHLINIRAKISEKQEEIIMQTIQEIGGETFYEITIDRDKVLEALKMYKNKDDYAEVKRGEWKQNPCVERFYYCSECNERIEDATKMPYVNFPYCHCGAKMEGDKDD